MHGKLIFKKIDNRRNNVNYMKVSYNWLLENEMWLFNYVWAQNILENVGN